MKNAERIKEMTNGPEDPEISIGSKDKGFVNKMHSFFSEKPYLRNALLGLVVVAGSLGVSAEANADGWSEYQAEVQASFSDYKKSVQNDFDRVKDGNDDKPQYLIDAEQTEQSHRADYESFRSQNNLDSPTIDEIDDKPQYLIDAEQTEQSHRADYESFRSQNNLDSPTIDEVDFERTESPESSLNDNPFDELEISASNFKKACEKLAEKNGVKDYDFKSAEEVEVTVNGHKTTTLKCR